MATILQKDDGILRKKSKKVLVKDIKSKKIQNILKEMREALAQHEDGVALAAPQIGHLVRIFIVSEKIFTDPHLGGPVGTSHDLIYINPEIEKASRKKQWMPEGCLSVRWKYGDVKRSEKITVKAYDENGVIFKRGASELLAQIFQHEMDHLNGVLFIDKAQNIHEMSPHNHEQKE